MDASWIVDNKLTPAKTANIGREEDPIMAYEDAIYYAKFERALGNLTITKTGCSDLDPNQSFVFTVRGGGQTIEVVIHGNGSVTIKDLPCGMYTVAENTNWSWRYDVVDTEGRAEQFVPVNGPDASVTFTNSRTRDKWLDGNAYCDNNWGTKTATKSN